MIGYEIPAWAFSSLPGAFDYQVAVRPASTTSTTTTRPGHQHKLETEGAGPTASNIVASNLADLVARRPDPLARVRRGRYVFSDGDISRRPRRQKPSGGGGERAVAIWLAAPGADALEPGDGRVIALPPGEVASARSTSTPTATSSTSTAQPQGPRTSRRAGCRPARPRARGARFYLDLYPALGGAAAR